MMDSSDRVSPPFRFGWVNDGVSRGGYPTIQNFRFLSRLNIKTMLSLVPEPPTKDLVEFCELMDITLEHIQVNRLAPLNSALMQKLTRAISILINADNQNIYVHCLDGRRITSLVVLLLRRLQGWTPQASFAEFFKYIVYNAKALRPVDEADRIMEFEKTSKDLGRFLQEMCDVEVPAHVAPWLSTSRQQAVPGVRFKYNPPLIKTRVRHPSGNPYAASIGPLGEDRGMFTMEHDGADDGSAGAGIPFRTFKDDLGLELAALNLSGVEDQMERSRRNKLRKAQHQGHGSIYSFNGNADDI